MQKPKGAIARVTLSIVQANYNYWISGAGQSTLPLDKITGVPDDAIGPYGTIKEAKDDLRGLNRFYARELGRGKSNHTARQ